MVVAAAAVVVLVFVAVVVSSSSSSFAEPFTLLVGQHLMLDVPAQKPAIAVTVHSPVFVSTQNPAWPVQAARLLDAPSSPSSAVGDVAVVVDEIEVVVVLTEVVVDDTDVVVVVPVVVVVVTVVVVVVAVVVVMVVNVFVVVVLHCLSSFVSSRVPVNERKALLCMVSPAPDEHAIAT